MNRELFVSSTPHETRVGLVEDDQLAEVYLERENEYTLAGSIYKGRVTRVLPGMQSAFVDIGLERDAFLYVSDFMEMEDQDEEVDDVPTPRAVIEARPQVAPAAQADPSIYLEPLESGSEEDVEPQEAAPQAAPAPPRENGGDREPRSWRGRRRRGRGGRFDRPDRSERFDRDRSADRPERTESRFGRPVAEAPRSDRADYGPPPGYQPIILPGESISKYRNRPAPSSPPASQGTAPAPAAINSAFPEDEPLFAHDAEPVKARVAAPESPVAEHRPHEQPETEQESSQPFVAAIPEVAAPEKKSGRRFGRRSRPQAAAEAEAEPETETAPQTEARTESVAYLAPLAMTPGERDEVESVTIEEFDQIEEITPHQPASARTSREVLPVGAGGAGSVEEEEIEDDEADLASYVEELEEDATFEELEEETRAAEEHREHAIPGLAAGAPVLDGPENGPAEMELGNGEVGNGDAEEDDDEEDDEIEEAQAEAEALLAAEASGNGIRAEVRAASPTSGFQRNPRPGFDRRGGPQRGRRGGRRFRRREPQQLPQITDLLKEGQEILVQIAKEPIGKKGARITSHIALPGRFLVYMPTVNHTGVSRKISSEEERQRLKRIILSERENGHGGFIVRTAAQGANEDELRADIRFLKGLWSEIKSRSESNKAPALIYHDLNVVERVLRDQVTSDFSAIWVDNEQEYERILRFANRFQPALIRRVKLYTKETPLFEQFGLSEEMNKALKSKVWLKSGGYIVINQTEALVAIDVNTGKYVGKTARLEDTIVKTNVDAIKEIVRQIRLRDLGGIIVIDFIDMDERRNRQKVMQALEEALRHDRAPSKVLQFNDFGLVAITRKRVKQSLERTIGTPCPYCAATGFVKSVPTVCNEIYVEMRKLSKHLDHPDVMLRVNPEVAKHLKTGSGRLLREMEELTGKTIIVKSDPALHQEQFDVT
jgi:ribonuclease G